MFVPTVSKQMQVIIWRQGLFFKLVPACPEVLRVLQTVQHVRRVPIDIMATPWSGRLIRCSR